MKKVLIVRRLWKIVEGTEAKPTGDPDAELEWDERNEEAHAQITLTLKDEPLNGVLHTSLASDAWTKLCERYEGKGKQSIAYLIGELFRGTLMDESPMEPQLNAMRQKALVLASLGQALDDSLIAIAMVISLPTSYSTLRTILMSTSDKITIEGTISQILVEEKSRRTPETQSALVAKAPEKPKHTSKSEKRKPGNCNYCKKPGHWEKECRKKKAEKPKAEAKDDEKSDKPKTELSAKIAAVVSEEDESALRLFVAREQKLNMSSVEWIVDSGASASMSCHRNWLKTFRVLNPVQHVVIGDGRAIEATGIGSVELEVEVGGGKVHRIILQEVYYVPDLEGNLLSVPRLTNKGFEVTFGQSLCAITCNGNIEALAKRRLGHSLYILKGRTWTHESVYIVQGTSPLLNAEEPITALTACTYSLKATIETWHRQLVHITLDSEETVQQEHGQRNGSFGINDSRKCNLWSVSQRQAVAQAYPKRIRHRKSSRPS